MPSPTPPSAKPNPAKTPEILLQPRSLPGRPPRAAARLGASSTASPTERNVSPWASNPEVSLKLARQLLAHDIDSSAYRMAQKKSKRQWAREWLAKYSPNWTNGHADRTRRELKKCLSLDRSASDCRYHSTRLLAVVRRTEERGLLYMAHGTLQMCGRVCRMRSQPDGLSGTCHGTLRGALPPAKVSHFAAITKSKQVRPPVARPGRLSRNVAGAMRLASGPVGLRAAWGVALGRLGRHRPGGRRVAR